jgi:hypothetical protein
VSSLKLKISTPVQPTPKGLGFYQIEDGSLYVPIGGTFASRRFFSYIDSPISRFDLDKEGRLMFMELSVPKTQWKIIDKFMPPEVVEPADIHWLDFRKSIVEPELLTNKENSRLLVKLSDETPQFNYYLADSIILQVSRSTHACGIFVNEIIDDAGGRKIAAFRRELSGKMTPASGLS